jgi:hypothetical protein
MAERNPAMNTLTQNGSPPPAPPQRLPAEILRLVRARDEQILKVVSLLDGLPHRGAADSLLEPLRPRLSEIRPPRPLTFTRLLFIPLDPIIVNRSAGWRFDDGYLPRSSLIPFAELARAGIGPAANAIEAELDGRTTDHQRVIDNVGERLWALASTVLARAESPPPQWKKMSGLDEAVFLPLCGVLSYLLGLARRLRNLTDPRQTPPEFPLRNLLRSTLTEKPEAVPYLVRLFTGALPQAEVVYAALANLVSPQNRVPVLERQIVLLLEEAGAQLSRFEGAPLEDADSVARFTAEIERFSALLDGFGAAGGAVRVAAPDVALPDLRRRVHELCVGQFSAFLERQIMEQMDLGEGEDRLDRLAALEDNARLLRRIDRVGRRIANSGAAYERRLAAAGEKIKEKGRLDLISRVRLLEILIGADEAYAFLLEKLPKGSEKTA